MKASELAALLMEHPDADVDVIGVNMEGFGEELTVDHDPLRNKTTIYTD